MKFLVLIFSTLIICETYSQIINQSFHDQNYSSDNSCGIYTDETQVVIDTKVVYNAKPDGYHIVFTTSFIGNSVENVEAIMNKKIDSLIKSVELLEIRKKDISVDVISLDPIFATTHNSNNLSPVGYKVNQNITFNITDFDKSRYLAKKCLDYGIYDIIEVKPYIFNPKRINDSIMDKTMEILEGKKEVCKKLGWTFSGGSSHFLKYTDVIYANESYLRSRIKNTSMYTHNMSQNSDIEVVRRVNTNSFSRIDLKTVDFIFNPHIAVPTIQFYCQIKYSYVLKPRTIQKADPSEEEKEKTKEPEKIFYVLDKDGNLKKIDF